MIVHSLRHYGIFWLLLLLFAGASFYVPDFFSSANIANVLMQSAPLGVLAVGQSIVILCGLIDLSVGQLLGLVVVLDCALMGGRSLMTGPAVLLALLLGGLIGFLNGILDRWLRIHPLILTFGMLSILQGVIFVYTDRSVGQASPEIMTLGNGTFAALPYSTVLLLAVTLGAHILLTRTAFGRHLYAVGGNEENARRAGIRTARVKIAAFVLSGTAAGIAGLIVAGRLGTGYPNAGTGYELDAIVASVLGGVSLAGGAGGVAGPVAAAIVLSIVSNALNLLGISAFAQLLIKGLVVVVAILATQFERGALWKAA